MAKSGKFGTFSGVFTPSILTILGVIMYLRLPNIVGQAGLVYAIGIIVVAHIISATTGMSVSSIATDKKVKAGGTYYMISRSLGLPIGGTLGLALFVGLSFSVSLYIIGFSESFLHTLNWETDINSIRITGSVVLLVITVITFISTSLALRMQFFIMAAIILSLMSIFFGNHDVAPASPSFEKYTPDIDLLVLFGIFFPAVTGFEAGVSMSGDLQDPKNSIPRGSLMAITVGLVVYILLTVFFAYTVDREVLINDPEVLLTISRVKWIVVAGIWGATISSALGSILGAPRIFQATAADKITPKFFSKGYGLTNEPRNALILTFVIAWMGILVGELNVIARIVSIFFITTYGFLNLSCAFEAWTSADFRPTFKTPIWVSLLGAVACFLVMIQLDFVATVGASIILGLLFLYLKRKELTLQSGDAWSGVWASLVKSGLQKLSREKLEPRNWRPNVIMFSGSEKDRPYLSELGMAIIGKLGILSSFELIQSDKPLLVKSMMDISEEPVERKYFHHKYECRDIYEGMTEISRVYGFSGIEPNTILMGWSKKKKNKDDFIQLIKGFHKSDYNAIFLSYDRGFKYGENRSIDVWWDGEGRNLSLAVNLLRHITSSYLWKEARIRLLVVNPDNTQEERVYKALERIVNQFRIEVNIKVINNGIDQLPVQDIIEQESDLTDLTVMGITDHEFEALEKSYDKLSSLSEKLRTVIFIKASTIFEEFDINLSHEYSKSARKEHLMKLPEISYSKYPEISDDIQKIDQHEKKQLNVFFQKVFGDFFAINREINEELAGVIGSITHSLLKVQIEDKDETIRIRKVIDKTRSEFYYKVKKIQEDTIEQKLGEQKEMIDSGINWYLDQLKKNIARFPKTLKIKYYKDDLRFGKEDTGAIKWIKMKRRMAHPFARTMIPGYINYKEAAQFFLLDNRHHFLNVLLNDFKTTSINYINLTQSLFITIEDKFDKAEKKLINDELKAGELNSIAEEIQGKFEQLKSDLDRIQSLYQNRLQFEFRRNIQEFNNFLERIDVNKNIKKLKRGRKFYSDLKERNVEFAGEWIEEVKLVANKNYLELVLLSFKDRVWHEADSFKDEIVQQVEIKFIKSLEDVKKKFEKYARSPKEKRELIFQKVSGTGDFLLHDFEERGKKLLKLANELPEKINISHVKSDEDDANAKEVVEVVDVLVSRIAHHFLESQYLGPLTEVLQKSSETIKNLVFNTNDLINLVRFNIDNIDKNEGNENEFIQSTIEDAIRQIEMEEERIHELIKHIFDSNDELLDELFLTLSSYKLPEVTKELSYLLRGYQGRKVITRFGALSERTTGLFKKWAVKLMYSKSQGILLAQKLAEEKKSKSTNEKVLDLIYHISPDEALLDRLPHFYRNLFSGRSNIGENFWIKRPIEESQFKKALDRYRNGYHGAIMVLGERNAGKTSLCNRLTKKHFVNEKVYHVFPSHAGSKKEDDFVRELQKSLLLEGNINDMLNALPNRSVIVVHDLELWWERTGDGLSIIKMMEWMINEYSYKCFFIFNMNPFAYELIDKIHRIEKLFIGVIKCQPFKSEELMELIISRHRSSGLHFKLNRKKEENISEIKLAGLFNAFFDYCEGNPGMALNAWLASIDDVSVSEISIVSPSTPSIKVLDEIPDMWKIALIQIIIHKRVSFDKLQEILELDSHEVGDLLLSLSRSGLIKERTNSIYYINPYVEPLLIKSFKQKGGL